MLFGRHDGNEFTWFFLEDTQESQSDVYDEGVMKTYGSKVGRIVGMAC